MCAYERTKSYGTVKWAAKGVFGFVDRDTIGEANLTVCDGWLVGWAVAWMRLLRGSVRWKCDQNVINLATTFKGTKICY